MRILAHHSPSRGVKLAVAFALATSACHNLRSGTVASHGVEFRGGQWFDGSRFVSRTMYVADGEFRVRKPNQIDSVVDLTGRYVVPPFADAHVHIIYRMADVKGYIAANVRDGIFYLKDQADAPVGRIVFHPLFNTPHSVDYISANQGWTSAGGHPVEVIQRAAAAPGPMGAFIRDSLDPGVVMQVETTADIDKRWAYFLAGRPAPDFVKVYLQNSQSHAALRNDPRGFGNRGMDPALVPYLVSRAREAGLTVSAHVFTAADFRVAVSSGVTHLAHIPGGPGATGGYLLTEADGQLAADHHVSSVATTVTKDFEGDVARTDRLVRDVYARNIAVLRRHRVPLVLGSDLAAGTGRVEADALARSGLFTNLDLLRMWSVDTPRSIFPARLIGELSEGYEASFLVLAGDPLADFSNTRKIVLRMKQGLVLQ
ncbi:MAG: amidohydrolase [Gemmatimonadaceae bacterium]